MLAYLWPAEIPVEIDIETWIVNIFNMTLSATSNLKINASTFVAIKQAKQLLHKDPGDASGEKKTIHVL